MCEQQGGVAIPVLAACNQLLGRVNEVRTNVRPDDGRLSPPSKEAFSAEQLIVKQL